MDITTKWQTVTQWVPGVVTVSKSQTAGRLQDKHCFMIEVFFSEGEGDLYKPKSDALSGSDKLPPIYLR